MNRHLCPTVSAGNDGSTEINWTPFNVTVPPHLNISISFDWGAVISLGGFVIAIGVGFADRVSTTCNLYQDVMALSFATPCDFTSVTSATTNVKLLTTSDHV